jgi:formylmethanofuran dehydrogenase subunit E
MEVDFTEDLRSAVLFHGHLCPGLILGYRAVRAAFRHGGVSRAVDEEVVAQVENDSCSADAVQALAGCTFGKGNLVFRDHGKQAFTFWNRTRNEGIRIGLRAPLAELESEEDRGLDPEQARQRMCRRLLEVEEQELFRIEAVDVPPPEPARIFSSVTCEACREPVMETRVRLFQGRFLCIPCLERAGS